MGGCYIFQEVQIFSVAPTQCGQMALRVCVFRDHPFCEQPVLACPHAAGIHIHGCLGQKGFPEVVQKLLPVLLLYSVGPATICIENEGVAPSPRVASFLGLSYNRLSTYSSYIGWDRLGVYPKVSAPPSMFSRLFRIDRGPGHRRPVAPSHFFGKCGWQGKWKIGNGRKESEQRSGQRDTTRRARKNDMGIVEEYCPICSRDASLMNRQFRSRYGCDLYAHRNVTLTGGERWYPCLEQHLRAELHGRNLHQLPVDGSLL